MLHTLETHILNALQSLFDQFGWAGVFALMVFENATGITPSEIILTFAGWMLIAAHDFSPALIPAGGLLAALGSTLGASITYWAARLGGLPLVERIARLFRIDPAHLTRAQHTFQRWGAGLVLVGRVIPGLRTLVSIPAGLARMSFPLFFFATFAGTFIWCTLLIGLGYLLGHEWRLVSELLRQFLPYLLVGGSLVLLLVFYWRSRLSPVLAVARSETEYTER